MAENSRAGGGGAPVPSPLRRSAPAKASFEINSHVVVSKSTFAIREFPADGRPRLESPELARAHRSAKAWGLCNIGDAPAARTCQKATCVV